MTLAAVVSGCTSAEQERLRADLDEQRALFEQQRLTSYELTQRAVCIFCDEADVRAKRVRVIDGAIASVVYLDDQAPVPVANLNLVHTIPDMFDLIESYFDDDPPNVAVTYDPSWHYPTRLSVRSEIDAGGELYLTDFVTPASVPDLQSRSVVPVVQD